MSPFLLILPFYANADVLPITSVEASSYFTEGKDTYKPKNISAGKVSKPWIEADKGSGLGSWIKVNLDGTQTINEIRLWNGNWYSFNEWDFYNRPAKLDVSFSDGSKQSFTLSNEKKVETLRLKKPVKSSSVKLTVRKLHAGRAYGDRTAISEIQVINSQPATYAKSSSIKASSTMKEDNDGNYIANNLQDLITDTAWCDSGTGKDASVTFNFGSQKNIKTVDFVNGYAADMKVFFAYSRVKTATLLFDDGSSHDIKLKGSMKQQTHNFPAKKTRSVTLKVNSVTKGKNVSNVCLSEARFQ